MNNVEHDSKQSTVNTTLLVPVLLLHVRSAHPLTTLKMGEEKKVKVTQWSRRCGGWGVKWACPPISSKSGSTRLARHTLLDSWDVLVWANMVFTRTDTVGLLKVVATW